MSYILDALKKSARERQQQGQSIQEKLHLEPTPPTPQPSRSLWWKVLLLLCVIAAGAAAVIFAPRARQQTEQHAQTTYQPATTEETTPPAEPPARQRSPEQTQPPAAPVISPPAQTPVPLLSELPGEMRAQIPKLSLAGHAYSTSPAQRMVMVNNRIVREGDNIGPDLQLEEITWNGVIFRYKEIQFRIDGF